MKPHKFLEEILYKLKSIERIIEILNQSQLNVEDKVEQISLLEEIKHDIISHNTIQELLVKTNTLNNKKTISNRQLRLIEKMHKSSSAIPIELIKSLSRTKIECQNLWKLSQFEISSLKKLKKRFADLIKLIREIVSIKSQQLKCSQYDSLLSEYDLDITEKSIKEIFPKIGKFFCENINKILEKQKKDKTYNIQKVTTQKQIELGSFCLQKMGITLYHTSYYHPIDYDESNFCRSLFLLLRNSGYEIYQKHLMQTTIKNHRIVDHIIYEAQGLLMERVIGTSKEFIEFIQPHINEKFAIKGKFSSAENLYLIFNKINLSSFLKGADELSLLAHIMLRTRLEQNIINNTLEVKDLHDAWLEGMKHYEIPVKAKNELDTYFQDKYWASGIIGYFPIKVIALITAIQIFSFIKNDHYEFLNAMMEGDFSKLINWLSKNICNTKYSFLDLLKKITGKNLNVECCINYLSEKYNLSR
ncbi:MAG: carboxypeptidase [Wolbachia endosymbiont of Menacanthus eurysternus]|nr:MAG: carboxypeptidase [Wolbachia endosymbiont of Menacanthus eurysternus]